MQKHLLRLALVFLSSAMAGGVQAAGASPAVRASAGIHPAGLPDGVCIPSNAPGICLDLGCGDGRRALEIAQRTRYTVFALARDEADCDKTRRAFDQAGLHGRRATAVTAPLRKLPLPNGYGNLIVAGDLGGEPDLREILRVLNPNGLAVVGGGATDAAKLKAALDAAGIRDYQMTGNCALFRGRLPEGADDWTHFGRAPDNIQTSRETGIRPPFRMQWYQNRPAYDDKATDHGSISNGRLVFRPAVPKPNPERYFAFDAFNGTLLWERPVSKGRNNYRYAHLDGVYYGTEGEKIVALDAATGEKLREYAVPDTIGSLWWMAAENHVLYGLLSTPALSNATAFGSANLFFAIDAQTGALLWKKACAPPALCWTAALDGHGGLFFTAIEMPPGAKPGKGVQAKGTACCLEAATGVERWHTDLGAMKSGYNDGLAAGCLDGKYFVWVCENAKGVQGTKSFDTKTGQLVRDYPGVHSWAEGFTAALDFIDGRIYSNPTAGHDPYQCYDIATGAKVKTTVDHLRGRDCVGRATATSIFPGGEGTCVQDLVNGREWSNPFCRPGDFSSPYPAEGLLFYLPSVCHCPHMFGAPIAFAPAGTDWQPPAADTNLAERLVTGPAFDQPLQEDGDAEWTHYRGGVGHTGEAKSAPQTPLKLAWEQKLGCRVTPPSFGAGLAFAGLHDAAVVALDPQSGEVRWRFLCGARVRVTPAYGRGRVVFGSDDGWVYCLEAKTGRLAWRFRAAPEERYVNAEGQMNSAWPSTAGVLLENGIAYCAAGLLSFDGGYLYALDLKTGKPVWAKRIGGPDRLNGAPHGVLALAGDTLILPVFAGRLNSAYRKTDGERIPWFEGQRSYWCFGTEAIADGDVFFYGGPRHSDDDWRGGHAPYTLMDVKTGWPYGTSGNTPEPLAPRNIAPVLGKTILLGDGVACDRKRFCEAQQAGTPKTAKGDSAIWNAAFWPDKSQRTTALALAGSVALAGGTSEVVAFEAKKDGKELGRGTVNGTILRNSLAVAGGRVYVATEEGSICCLTP
jgi:outer membrane protein assembly factor BamB